MYSGASYTLYIIMINVTFSLYSRTLILFLDFLEYSYTFYINIYVGRRDIGYHKIDFFLRKSAHASSSARVY